MSYSSTGILALVILLIINHEFLRRDPESDAILIRRDYRQFLCAVAVYFVADIFWGFLYEAGLTRFAYFDTVVYFAAMAAVALLWTRCVIIYLKTTTRATRLLAIVGWVIFTLEIAFIVINFFIPELFRFDADGSYRVGPLRYLSFGLQFLMFILSGFYSLTGSRKTESPLNHRYQLIGVFGIVMGCFVVYQILFPLLPIYAAGLLICTCVIHIFIFEAEKEDASRKLRELLALEQSEKSELKTAREIAYIDGLTKVKNVHAYAEATENINTRIAAGTIAPFGVIAFDLNNLKKINDTMGHETGDRYICEAAHFICHSFTHSPVFRIGGDEFTALLEGEDYENRHSLIEAFERAMEENRKNGKVVVSAGLAEYRPGEDADYHSVFERADRAMYKRKEAIKNLL